jgi:AraC-like DNA-binding protein
MCKTLKFGNEDLLGSALSAPKALLLLNVPLDGFDKTIKGEYSFFKNTKMIIWEGNVQTDSEIKLSFCPSSQPPYFYLLSFESSKNLNKRIVIDLPISTALLDNQSKKGALFWVSSVGVEMMLPPETQINFQLIGIPQNIFFNYLQKSSLKHLKMPFLNKKHNIPAFYFSNAYYIFQNLFFNLREVKNTQERIIYVMNLMSNFLMSANEPFLEGQISFRDFYNMLLIEKVIQKLPAMREPNIDLLGENFRYSTKKLNRLFLHVFGISIIEYHRGFHMKYAKWLIEEKQMKIDEVSKRMGFRTTNLFSQVFKRHFFFMPNKYKPK